MSVSVKKEWFPGGVMLLRAKGEVDISSIAKFSEEIFTSLQEPAHEVILSLEGLDFLESSGLRFLIEAQQKFREKNINLVLVCTRPLLSKIFRIAGLGEHFKFAGSETTAIQQAIDRQDVRQAVENEGADYSDSFFRNTATRRFPFKNYEPVPAGVEAWG